MSSTLKPVTPLKFSVDNLKVDPTKKPLDNSPAAIVYINYNGGKLLVQAPRMPIPYDAGDFKDASGQGNGKYKVNLDFRNRETDSKVAAYHDMLEQIDEFVMREAVKNSKNWLGKQTTYDGISMVYTRSLRVSKDKQGNERSPTQNVALKKDRKTGAFDATLWDDQQRKMEGVTPLDVLRRGAEVTCVLHATSIWVAGGKFGINWKLHQARVDKAADSSDSTYCFADDEVDDDEELAAAPAPAPVAPAFADDEDEDEEDVVEPVPVPAPAPAPKAKVAVPKKTAKA